MGGGTHPSVDFLVSYFRTGPKSTEETKWSELDGNRLAKFALRTTSNERCPKVRNQVMHLTIRILRNTT